MSWRVPAFVASMSWKSHFLCIHADWNSIHGFRAPNMDIALHLVQAFTDLHMPHTESKHMSISSTKETVSTIKGVQEIHYSINLQVIIGKASSHLDKNNLNMLQASFGVKSSIPIHIICTPTIGLPSGSTGTLVQSACQWGARQW